jgi:hypothetical protein
MEARRRFGGAGLFLARGTIETLSAINYRTSRYQTAVTFRSNRLLKRKRQQCPEREDADSQSA